MKKTQALDKLQRMIKEDLPMLMDTAIIRDGDSYDVFSRYRISPKDQSFLVEKQGVPVGEFSSLKSAISWCIAEKHRQNRLCWEIERLDQKKLMLQSDLETRTHLFDKIKDKTRKDAVRSKLDIKKRNLTQVNNQLDKCISLAKYWQIRGFNNETARIGRQPTNRTNR